MGNTKTINISIRKDVFETLERERGLTPRSTIINQFIKDGLKTYKAVVDPSTVRVHIDLDVDMSVEFEALKKHYENECGEQISNTDFFKKVFLAGFQSKQETMAERVEWQKEMDDKDTENSYRKAFK